jgi:hypothetical protein
MKLAILVMIFVTSPILALAADPQFDYILNACKETELTLDPKSALRAVDPAGFLYIHYQKQIKRNIDLSAIKTTMLETPKHGKLIAGISNYGRTTYRYDSDPNYIGKDNAAFVAEFEGKRYKILLDIIVLESVDDNSPVCGPSKLIGVAK